MCTRAWTRRASDSSGSATTQAAGCPCATSRARFGPVSTPAGTPGQHLGHHLGHPKVGADLNSLGQADDGLDPVRSGCAAGEDGAKPVGWHSHEDDAGALDRLSKRRGHDQSVGEVHAREVPSRSRGSAPMEVASSGDRAHNDAGCEAPTMRRHGRAPRTGTDHCHPVVHGTRDYGDPGVAVAHSPVHCRRCRGRPCRPQDPLRPARTRARSRGRPRSRSRRSGRPSVVWARHARPSGESARAINGRHTSWRPVPRSPLRWSATTTEVADWAADLGAAVMWEPGQGLNGAVRAGVERLAAAGVRWVTVAHGDLPRARDLGRLASVRRRHPGAGPAGRRHQRPAATGRMRLPLCLRPGSFRAHRAEATRLGLPVRVLRDPDLAYDVDWPADVVELGAAAADGARTRSRGPEGPRSHRSRTERSA